MNRIVISAHAAQFPAQHHLLALGMFALIACALSFGSSAHAATDVWDANGANPPNGIWGTGLNWVDNSTPGTADLATFNIAGTYTVSFAADPQPVQALSVLLGNVTLDSGGGAGRALQVDVNPSTPNDVLVAGGNLTIGTSVSRFSVFAGDDFTVRGGSTVNVRFGIVQAADMLLSPAGSTGSSTVVVDGFGLSPFAVQFNSSSSVTVGDNGAAATLTYRNQGYGSLNGAAVKVGVSSNPGTVGTLNVESNALVGASNLIVGSAAGGGSGTVNLTGGSLQCSGTLTLNATGNININGGSFSFYDVAREGGAINFNSGSLTANGSFRVGQGGLLGNNVSLASSRQLSAPDIVVDTNGQLALSAGGIRNTDHLDVQGYLDINGGLLAAMTGTFTHIEGDGVVRMYSSVNTPIVCDSAGLTINIVAESAISIGSVTSLNGFHHQGTLDVGANSVTLNSAGYARLGALTTLVGGTIAAPNGVVFASGSNFQGRGAVNARVSGEAGSVIDANGALALGVATSPAGFNFGGELRVRQHTVTLLSSNQATLGNLTTLGSEDGNGVAIAGTLNSTYGIVVDFGDAITGYGTVNSTNTLAKRTIINGTAQGSFPTQPLTFTGYVKGVGTFSNVIFTGTFAPGLSPAMLTVGNLGFSSTNMLIMELGGTAPGSGYDQIQASGTLGLNGTLAVTLINGFNPAAGNLFNLFDWSSLAGTFSSLQLPALGGSLVWDTTQLYTNGVLLVATPGLPGDYTNNGIVDAADYVLWRKSNNTGVTLPNDSTVGTDATDYAVWRTHFGQTSGSGSGANANAAVPEPTTLVLLMFVIASWCLRRLRDAWKVPTTRQCVKHADNSPI